MDEGAIRKKLLERVEAHLEDALALNDYMAENPELGSHEFESSKRMIALLRSNGIEVGEAFDGFPTAYLGKINPERKNRFAILAEYDALPELGHACGHCASGSGAVLAALALNDIREELPFGIDIMGTPDEEVEGIKCIMSRHGVFNDYDFAILVHMAGYTAAKINFLAMDGRFMRWHGRAAHAAAAPELGRNALNASRIFLDAVDMMRQHLPHGVMVHGIYKNGGSASNVVPDYSELEMLMRAPTKKQLDDVISWCEDIARAAGTMTRTEAEIAQYGNLYCEVHVSDLQEATMEEAMDDIGVPHIKLPETIKISSDIGNADYHCPVFHPMMDIGKPYEVHTPEFAAEMCSPGTHKAIENAAKLICAMAAKLYARPELLAEIRREHKEYRGL